MKSLEDMAREAGLIEPEWHSISIDNLPAFAALVRAQDARRIEVLQHERDHARAKFENAVRLLTGINNLLYPAPVTLGDGRTMVFRPENPHEFMHALSDRIRALPDELAALKDRP